MAVRTGTSIVVVSTPMESDNYVSKLANKQKEGEQLINVLHIGKPCDECWKTDKPYLCPHQLQPPWKSSKRQQKYSRYLYSGKQDQNLREQFAVITESGTRCFEDIHVQFLSSAPAHKTTRSPDFIYMFADPAEGGENDFGITMCFWDESLFVVSFFHIFLFLSLSISAAAWCPAW